MFFTWMFDLWFDSPSPEEVDPSQRAVPVAPTVITARALGNAIVMVRPKDILRGLQIRLARDLQIRVVT